MLLCSVGGPALFIHDKCVLHAWAALKRLNTSWKWSSVPRVGWRQWKSGWSPDTLHQACLELPLMLKVIFAQLLFIAHFCYLLQLQKLCWRGVKGCFRLAYKSLSMRASSPEREGTPRGRRVTLAAQFIPPPSVFLFTRCITHTRMHASLLTFVITVITKRRNEVIFLFPNNRLSKQQMNLLPPAMWNRHIIFKFQFIFLWRLLSCGAATHTIVFFFFSVFFPPCFSILLAIRQWDVTAVCQKRLIFHSCLLENLVELHLYEYELCAYWIYMNGAKLVKPALCIPVFRMFGMLRNQGEFNLSNLNWFAEKKIPICKPVMLNPSFTWVPVQTKPHVSYTEPWCRPSHHPVFETSHVSFISPSL